jgi:hypothetical protein
MPRPKHHKPAKRIGRPNTESRELRKRILIVCEGKKTEPNYFESMRVELKIAGEAKGTGSNTLNLVEYATTRENEGFDEIWCVFDKDSFSDNDFNNAIQKARQKGFHVAYSNECFELWYILHYNYHTTAHQRNHYFKRLGTLIGESYQKNDSSMYQKLNDKLARAIKNAERLLKTHQGKTPARANPSTTVHQLVLRLQEIAKEQELN